MSHMEVCLPNPFVVALIALRNPTVNPGPVSLGTGAGWGTVGGIASATAAGVGADLTLFPRGWNSDQ